jgi:adenylate cyclase class 2
MRYEVEMKFPAADPVRIERRLRELGAAIGDGAAQSDAYFAHPVRDFSATDEALRLRSAGERNWITYKGPKVDATTKTRREIELPLGAGDATRSEWMTLLEILGFTKVADVRKKRRGFRLEWEGAPLEGSLDVVDGLGDFVELEIVAEAAGVDPARARLAGLARELALGASERRSYLELILEREAGRIPPRDGE